MSSVTKKFGLNFPRVRTGKKKSGETRDELDVDSPSLLGGPRKGSHGSLSPNIAIGTPLVTGSKSNSLSSVNSEGTDPAMDHEQVMLLTHYVRSFSDALVKLKAVFCSITADVTPDELRVSAHERLAEVLSILKEVIQKYPALHTTEVLTSAAILITKIKSSRYEEVGQDSGNLLFIVDQLSIAFSSSVSDFLMGDIDNFPSIGKTKSYDNLATDSVLDGQSDSPEKRDYEVLTGEKLDDSLMRQEAGVEMALQRAKVWAKYAKEIINYVERRATLETEYAKSISKLANGVKNIIREETYLPMQSIYCTAFDQDSEFARTCQATLTLIQNQKFMEPLSQRRAEHEKERKALKDAWTRELRRMHESVSNLRKAKALYITRQQEFEKAKEAAQRAETDSLAQSSAGQAAKAEKKRKLEDDALTRAAEAETGYKACVADANHRHQALERVKGDTLCQTRELIYHSDEVMRNVTVGYFQLLHTASAPTPAQFQALCESSQLYEPGSQYAEYVKRLHAPTATTYQPEPYVFEPYTADTKLYELRKPSSQSSGSSSEVPGGHGDDNRDGSRLGHMLKTSGVGQAMATTSAAVAAADDGADTDSVSGSSSKSQESSPSASPYQQHRHLPLGYSASLSELPGAGGGAGGGAADQGKEPNLDPKFGLVVSEQQVSMTFRGVALSHAAQSHSFKKLRTLSKCRECETYVLFQGAECERCGLSTHKKCLENLHWECGHKSDQRRMTTFGVDFNEHLLEQHTEIPYILTKCMAEIDKRGLDVEGIYRKSGVKSKVERLCQNFEMDADVDLSDHQAHVITNVLKLYLRQLPEPLLTFRLYPELTQLAKDLQDEQQRGGRPVTEEVIQKLAGYMNDLPPTNRKTCRLLFHHLKRVTDHKDENQMNASNLGIVFGPTLLRPSAGTVSLDSLIDMPHQTRAIEYLICHVQKIFGSDASAQPPTSVTAAAREGERVDGADRVSPTSPGPRSPKGRLSSTLVPPEITENLLEEINQEMIANANAKKVIEESVFEATEEEEAEAGGDDPPAADPRLSPDPAPQPPPDTQQDSPSQDKDPVRLRRSSGEGVEDDGGAEEDTSGEEGEEVDGRSDADPPGPAGSAKAWGPSTWGSSSETQSNGSSPGLKKRLLPSQVMTRTLPHSSSSTASLPLSAPDTRPSSVPVSFTALCEERTAVRLTKPRAYSPPLQRRLYSVKSRGPLPKPGSLDERPRVPGTGSGEAALRSKTTLDLDAGVTSAAGIIASSVAVPTTTPYVFATLPASLRGTGAGRVADAVAKLTAVASSTSSSPSPSPTSRSPVGGRHSRGSRGSWGSMSEGGGGSGAEETSLLTRDGLASSAFRTPSPRSVGAVDSAAGGGGGGGGVSSRVARLDSLSNSPSGLMLRHHDPPRLPNASPANITRRQSSAASFSSESSPTPASTPCSGSAAPSRRKLGKQASLDEIRADTTDSGLLAPPANQSPTGKTLVPIKQDRKPEYV